MKYSFYIKFRMPLCIALLTMLSCQKTQKFGNDDYEKAVRGKALEYFETFAERTDWDKLCSFYREDLHFQDITLQLDLDSLWRFRRFYKWDEEGDRFKKMHPDQKHLHIEALVADSNVVAAKGHLNPFYYDGTLIDTEWGMDFTIWLRFDDDLMIIEQTDWFEYDPFTLESTIKRCRENGFEAIPEWLDLSIRE